MLHLSIPNRLTLIGNLISHECISRTYRGKPRSLWHYRTYSSPYLQYNAWLSINDNYNKGNNYTGDTFPYNALQRLYACKLKNPRYIPPCFNPFCICLCMLWCYEIWKLSKDASAHCGTSNACIYTRPSCCLCTAENGNKTNKDIYVMKLTNYGRFCF